MTIKIDPTNVDAYVSRADAYVSQHKAAPAFADLNTAIAKHPTSSAPTCIAARSISIPATRQGARRSHQGA